MHTKLEAFMALTYLIWTLFCLSCIFYNANNKIFLFIKPNFKDPFYLIYIMFIGYFSISLINSIITIFVHDYLFLVVTIPSMLSTAPGVYYYFKDKKNKRSK